MTVCTEEDILAVLIILRQQVPGQHPEVSQGTAQVWHSALALYSADVVQHVALHWSGESFPSREEFRRACAVEQQSRREAAEEHLQSSGAPVDRCPECDGGGWRILSTIPVWVADPCPRGCQPPSPRHRRSVVRARHRPEPARTEPRKVVDVTSRITGERDPDGF